MSKKDKVERYYGEPMFMYKCINAYKEVENPSDWLECPKCKLKPVVWEFDNGRSTACGCGESEYRNFSIYAESIMSCLKRNSINEYDSDDLRKNWNHYIKTGEEVFKYTRERDDGKW